jgi:hypothetical protein
MKYYLSSLLFLLLTFNLVSCKKDKNTPSAALLMGTWELRQQSAEIGMFRDYPPGNGNILKFSIGNKYEFSGENNPVESGTFRLTSEVARYDNQQKNLIRFGDSPTRNVYTIVADTLSLSTYHYLDNGNPIMDGGGATYVRIQP